MWRGLWLAALHNHSVMASSALTQSCNMAIPAFALPSPGELIPSQSTLMDIVSFEPSPSAAA